MNNLFVFGIGGTGSRVMKALTMLLATGVKLNYNVIPVIIDPDENNGDLTKNLEILNKYIKIRNEIHTKEDSESDQFFSTSIENIFGEAKPFQIRLNLSNNKLFKDYIDYDLMDADSIKPLTELLFSDSNLNADLSVGFKGHPNMGSVVLNQVTNAPDFLTFANKFNTGDRIFIIGSIFGGTGASGFPLISYNIRTIGNIRDANNQQIPNHATITNAIIGGTIIMPYFKVESDNKSQIDSSTFVGKTKAALHYYEEHLTEYNALYYLGLPDKYHNEYSNHEGSSKQKNDAHFVELAAALSLLDFVTREEIIPNSEVYLQYGVDISNDTLIFKGLGDITKGIIAQKTTQFAYLINFLNKCVFEWKIADRSDKKQDSLYKKFNKTKHPFLYGRIGHKLPLLPVFSSTFFKDPLYTFFNEYTAWFDQMKENGLKFTPFDDFSKNKDLQKIVQEVDRKKAGRLLKTYSWDYNDYIRHLNHAEKLTGDCYSVSVDKKGDEKGIKKLLKVFYAATDEITTKRMNLK